MENTTQPTKTYAELEAERVDQHNAKITGALATAKAGRGFVAVVGPGAKVHAARHMTKGHSGYFHPRPLCQGSTSRAYFSLPAGDPHTMAVTCKRCLASLEAGR